MSAWPAYLALHASCTSVDCSKTDVRLYDELMQLPIAAGFETSKTHDHDIPIATYLALWHPKQPDSLPFVTSPRLIHDRGPEIRPVMCDDPRGRRKLIRLIDRAIQLLDSPHQQANREWLQRTRRNGEAVRVDNICEV